MSFFGGGIVSQQISDSTTAGRTLLTAADAQAQREAIDIFVVVANFASLPVTGQIERVYITSDTQKVYAWSNATSTYSEISPNTHTRTGTNNINVGETALASPSLSGGSNTAVGANALNANTTGFSNVAVGSSALSTNTGGAQNTSVGLNALNANSNGNNNTAVGIYALSSNTASNNTAVGQSALSSNTSGGPNVAVGANALFGNTIGNNQVAVGHNALLSSNAYNNTAIGSGAGSNCTTGSVNTLIGYNANVDSGGRELCVVIGGGATSPAVNGSLAIGGSGASAMGGLTTGIAPAGASTYLRIWLNGVEYRITAIAAT